MKWPFKREQRNDPSWNALRDRSAISVSGQYVDVKSAESIAAVFGAVQALSESTACLPLHVYQRLENGDRVRADDHPLARVLRQAGMPFRESMTAAVLLHGNAYARIESNGAGELVALHPMNPRSVTVVKLDSGRHRYDYTDDAGHVVRLLEDEVFHLADRTEPGSIVGKSRIAIARETLGLGLALREHGASTFANGTSLSGVLTYDSAGRPMTAERREELRDAWAQRHQGVSKAGSVAVIGGNAKFQPLSMSMQDAEWIASQQFSVVEVARIFRVPPTMLQDLSHASYSNTAELGQQFVRYSLQRWLTLWEGEIQRQLLGPIARRRYHAEHSVEGLLRGAPEQRANYYQTMIASGVMTVDECRRLENLPALGNDDAA